MLKTDNCNIMEGNLLTLLFFWVTLHIMTVVSGFVSTELKTLEVKKQIPYSNQDYKKKLDVAREALQWLLLKLKQCDSLNFVWVGPVGLLILNIKCLFPGHSCQTANWTIKRFKMSYAKSKLSDYSTFLSAGLLCSSKQFHHS